MAGNNEACVPWLSLMDGECEWCLGSLYACNYWHWLTALMCVVFENMITLLCCMVSARPVEPIPYSIYIVSSFAHKMPTQWSAAAPEAITKSSIVRGTEGVVACDEFHTAGFPTVVRANLVFVGIRYRHVKYKASKASPFLQSRTASRLAGTERSHSYPIPDRLKRIKGTPSSCNPTPTGSYDGLHGL